MKFDKFKFDATPYIIAANSFSKQFAENETKNKDICKAAFDQLDSSISEKLSECSKMTENLKKIQIENLNLEIELDALTREDEQQQRSNFDLKDGVCVYF